MDPATIIGGIRAVGGALSGPAGALVGGLFDARNTDKTNQANKDIANQNLAFQRENLEYQKALQQQVFEREDTAYQRTVDDMRAAGLSPLSMQSTNGAGEAIQTEALNNGYQAQKRDSAQYYMQGALSIAESLQQIADREVKRDELRMQQQKATADIAFTNAQTSRLLKENSWLDHFLQLDFDAKHYSNQRSQLGVINDILDTQARGRRDVYESGFGLVDGMTPDERKAAILSRALGLTDGLTSDTFHNGETWKNNASTERNGKELLSGMQSVYGAMAIGSALKDVLNTVSEFMPKNPFGSRKK